MKIPKNAFMFCKMTITLIAWTALILRSKELVLLAFLLLLSSAILTIRRAPLIMLYSFARLPPGRTVELDVKAMRFAHILGSVFSGVCAILVYMNSRFGWAVVLVFAVMKTISAAGFCPGEKIYTCMKGGCCSIKK
jgi:hypothetical protein